MSGLSTYLAGAYLNWIKGVAMPAAPAAVYVALYDGDPTDAGTGGTDVTLTIDSTGRKAATFGAISAKAISNSADVDFGTADAAANVTHFAVWDAATAGNMIGSAALTAARAVALGDPCKFLVGDLDITLVTP